MHFFCSIQNTEETGQGLCSYPESYFPTKTDQDCPFLPGELKCKDCARFMEDMACMGCDAEDPAEDCCGFIDILEEQVYEAMAKWTMRGENIRTGD